MNNDLDKKMELVNSICNKLRRTGDMAEFLGTWLSDVEIYPELAEGECRSILSTFSIEELEIIDEGLSNSEVEVAYKEFVHRGIRYPKK